MTHTQDPLLHLLREQEQAPSLTDEAIDELLQQPDQREWLRTMALTRQSLLAEKPLPTAEEARQAWQLFAQKHGLSTKRKSLFGRRWAWAAVLLLLLSVAGMAMLVGRSKQSKTLAEVDSVAVTPVPSQQIGSSDSQEIAFDNAPLTEILAQIGATYGKEVRFESATARQLRLSFVWNKAEKLADVVALLNHFEHINIVQEGSTLVVR